MSISPLLSVALGGAIGASLRFGVGHWVLRVAGTTGFPLAIVSVNIIGSFLMGLAVVALNRAGVPHWQPFVMTGILGGFTTFSAFSLEAFTLWEQGQGGAALLYVAVSVLGSIIGLALGVMLARGVFGL